MSVKLKTEDYVYLTVECLTGLASVIGNILVLVAIKRFRSLRTITNCFIGSLAAADVIVGIAIPPTLILVQHGLPREFHSCVLLNSLVVIFTNISVLSLLDVALDRFVAISNPFLYQRTMSRKRAMIVVAVTWVVAIVLGLIPNMGWNLGHHSFTLCFFINVIDLRYMVYLIFFGVNLPLLFIILCIYLYIFYIIRKQQQSIKQQESQFTSKTDKRNHQKRTRDVQGAKGLAYVIILFALCWLPIHIMNCVIVFAPEDSPPVEVILVAIVLSHANSVFNPVLYAFSNSKFKIAMKRIMCGRREDTHSATLDTTGTGIRSKDYMSEGKVPIPQGDVLDDSSYYVFNVEESSDMETADPTGVLPKFSPRGATGLELISMTMGMLMGNKPQVTDSKETGESRDTASALSHSCSQSSIARIEDVVSQVSEEHLELEAKHSNQSSGWDPGETIELYGLLPFIQRENNVSEKEDRLTELD